MVDDNVTDSAAAADGADEAFAPDLPSEPAPPITSRFLFVDVAALRAKQLRRGARPRLDPDVVLPRKPERIAMEEVRHGLVYYDVPAPKRPMETHG